VRASQAKLARAAEERDFLKHLNDNLLSNQRELQEQIRAAQAASRDSTDGREAHIKARRVLLRWLARRAWRSRSGC
jgi:hypothetical protein